MRKRRKRNLRILIATAHSQVSAALQEAAGGARVKCKTDEALSVRGVYEGLPGVDLAIIDLDGLIDSLDLPRDTLVNTLETSAIPVATSEEFVAEPMAWLEKAVASTGLLDALPPRTVVFAGYSGGVGKTTLAMNLARYVTQKLKLPVALIEVAYGVGALKTLADPGLPDLYSIVTQGGEPGKWNGITAISMEYSSARLLLQRIDDIRAKVREIANAHALTIIDAAAANPLLPAFVEGASYLFAVADPRPDAVANSMAFLGEIERENHFAGETGLLLNKVNGLGAKLALGGLESVARLPLVSRPDREPKLAQELLQVIYPGWRAK